MMKDYLTHFSDYRNLYKGNTITHWAYKAIAYGDYIMKIWKIPEIREYADGKNDLIDTIKLALTQSNEPK